MHHTLIIDSSSLIFRSYFATVKWARDIHPAVNLYKKWLMKLKGMMNPEDDLFCAIDLNNKESDNFKEFDHYKSGRHTPDELKKNFDLFHKASKSCGFKIAYCNGEEADDVIASLISKIKDSSFIVVSSDKDLLQLVSEENKVVALKPITKNGTKFKAVKEDDVCNDFGIQSPDRIVDLKAFIGDGSDGYPGVKGVGMKRAQDLLDQFNDFDGIYQALEEGKIKGAVSRYLNEQKDIAKTCYQLAKLNDNLDIEIR